MAITEPDTLKETIYCLALTRIKGLSFIDIKKLLLHFKSAKAIFNARRNDIIRIIEPKKDVAAVAELLLRFDGFSEIEEAIKSSISNNVRIITLLDDEYPPGLKNIIDPPVALFVKGDILPEDSLALAMVGTRRPDAYGRWAANWLARELAEYGITLVSGMARGIDTEVHRTALENKTRTIAVMGTGQNQAYPRENTKLKGLIEQNGATVTEYFPDDEPLPWHFPARNRIIAGLSLGTIVIQAPQKSGALITAHLALDYNREVFALPANINLKKSMGCNYLIRQGAKPIFMIEDVIEELNITVKKTKKKKEHLELSLDEMKVMENITDNGAFPEEIVQNSGLPSYKVSSILLQLEIKKIIRKMPGNKYMLLVS
ncbi:MAG: DNA-processing protein DprA [Vulcanimicrobiota bacterium]